MTDLERKSNASEASLLTCVVIGMTQGKSQVAVVLADAKKGSIAK
jgi:hypothetical protein